MHRLTNIFIEAMNMTNYYYFKCATSWIWCVTRWGITWQLIFFL